MAGRFATNDKVIFDTNNEYHDMDNTLVGQLNQAAINGIRAAGAKTQYIFAEGNSWTGAWTWVRASPCRLSVKRDWLLIYKTSRSRVVPTQPWAT